MRTPWKSAVTGAVSVMMVTLTLTAVTGDAAAQQQSQQQMTTRLRGVITAVTADRLEIRTRDGKEVPVAVTAGTRVASIELTGLDAIKPDSYIGTAAAPQPDGTLKALEVHVFPPAMRGAGDGSRPWDLQPNSVMTNGAIGSIVGTDGRVVTVKYQNGEKKVVIPPDVPVVNIVPADPSLFVTGAKVVVQAAKGNDGTLSALSVSVGKDGITPPM